MADRIQITANQRYRIKIREYEGFGIIYMIKSKIDNRIYIGQTIRSLKERIKEHTIYNRYCNLYIRNAIKKYGIENFITEIIEVCSSQENLDSNEIKWITYYKSNIKEFGFNLTSGGEHCLYNEETRKKISSKMTGDKNHRFGIKVSEETRKKMSEAHKNSNANYSLHKNKIICVEDNTIYDSINEASENNKIPLRTLGRILKSGDVSKKHHKSFLYINKQNKGGYSHRG